MNICQLINILLATDTLVVHKYRCVYSRIILNKFNKQLRIYQYNKFLQTLTLAGII